MAIASTRQSPAPLPSSARSRPTDDALARGRASRRVDGVIMTTEGPSVPIVEIENREEEAIRTEREAPVRRETSASTAVQERERSGVQERERSGAAARVASVLFLVGWGANQFVSLLPDYRAHLGLSA